MTVFVGVIYDGDTGSVRSVVSSSVSVETVKAAVEAHFAGDDYEWFDHGNRQSFNPVDGGCYESSASVYTVEDGTLFHLLD